MTALSPVNKLRPSILWKFLSQTYYNVGESNFVLFLKSSFLKGGRGYQHNSADVKLVVELRDEHVRADESPRILGLYFP